MTVLSSGRELLFSPEDPVRSRILQLIGDAKRTVDLQCYAFTLEDCVDMLGELHRAGKAIRVIISGDPDNGQRRKAKTVLDRVQDEQIARLKALDIPHVLGLSRLGGILHGKYGIVDAMVAWHGSYNLTVAAEYQGNHVCVEHESEGIRPFMQDFESNWTRLAT